MSWSEPEPLGRVCVCMPTYNEAGNIAMVVGRLRQAVPAADVLILDDNSPDRTGAIADELAAGDEQVHVLHRPGKNGLGPAYLAGFAWAAQRGYHTVVEMDADGSHRPEELPALLLASGDADVVIGSRWVPGGSVLNWPVHRRALSVGANSYARWWLGIGVRDSTAGFRVYRMSALERMQIGVDGSPASETVASQGYCFQVDLTVRALEAGLRVVEVPITFVEREVGASKMTKAIVLEASVRVAVWGGQRRVRRLRERLANRERFTRWHHLEENT